MPMRISYFLAFRLNRANPNNPQPIRISAIGSNTGAINAELDAIGVKLRAEWAKKAGADAKAILDAYYKAAGK